MQLKLLKAKLHGARVTQADLNYVGSVTIDRSLMEAAGIEPNEVVLIADATNGHRLTTYVIAGEPGSGVIGINGAAAHLVKEGDTVLIMAFAYMTPEEASRHKARILIMNDDNTVKQLLNT